MMICELLLVCEFFVIASRVYRVFIVYCVWPVLSVWCVPNAFVFCVSPRFRQECQTNTWVVSVRNSKRGVFILLRWYFRGLRLADTHFIMFRAVGVRMLRLLRWSGKWMSNRALWVKEKTRFAKMANVFERSSSREFTRFRLHGFWFD